LHSQAGAWERDSSLANNYERQRVISPVQRFVIFCMLNISMTIL
jgi:hypothetical protein